MSAKEHKGSMKIIGGQEVWTIHNFPPDQEEDGRVIGASIMQLEDGGFIYGNGEPVRDRERLMLIPEQYRGEALAWWDRTFGEPDVKEEVKPQPEGPTIAEAMALIQELRERLEATLKQPAEPDESVPSKPGSKKSIKQQMGVEA